VSAAAGAGPSMSEHRAGVEAGAPSAPDDAAGLDPGTEAVKSATVQEQKAGQAAADTSLHDDVLAAPSPAPPITVIAVHGNGGSSHRFSLVIPQMPDGTEMVAVTLPGFGGRPADPSLRSVRDYARHLATLVAGAPRPRVLLGHGVGGSIALQLAQQQDVEVDGLILHAPVGAHLDSRWLPWIMTFPSLRALALRLFTNEQLRPIFRWFLFSRSVPHAYVDRFFTDYATCSAFGEMFEMITPEWFSTLRPVNVPSALVWGLAERVVPVEHLNAFTLLLPDPLALQVPGWGHFPMAEAPRSYADEIAELARALVARCQAQSDAVTCAAATPGLPPLGQTVAVPEDART
jgi:pimeloyl-ACP methyl ester carboxylesterase